MEDTNVSKKKIFSLDRTRTLPFILTGIIILADQAVKFFIARNWPRIGTVIKDVFNNDFLLICHVRNKAIAFSLGRNVPESLRPILFVAIPLLVLGFLCWYYLKSNEFTRLQRWAVAGIIGGGLGNIIDRIFRPDGVVDFISIKIYGLFGMERWPVFNIADSSVVVCCIILFITILFASKKPTQKESHE
jgi:signal peptidase II